MTPSDLVEDDELWHPSGWSPVYDGVAAGAQHLVGFTTLQVAVPLFRMSRPTGDDDGSFYINGEALRVLKGEFYAWTVVDGDWRDMPDFWAI